MLFFLFPYFNGIIFYYVVNAVQFISFLKTIKSVVTVSLTTLNLKQKIYHPLYVLSFSNTNISLNPNRPMHRYFYWIFQVTQ